MEAWQRRRGRRRSTPGGSGRSAPILLLARRRRRVRHERLVARRPRSAGTRRRPTQFDVRRVEFHPGEIRDPRHESAAGRDHDRLGHRRRRDRPVHGRRAREAQAPPLEHGRRPLRLGRRTIRSLSASRARRGIETVEEIAAAVETPTASAKGFLGYGIIGFLVGVVPVALGLLWLPSLRRADPQWLAAFMALTAGLLSFLGVEALFEAFELQAALPGGARRRRPRAARRRDQLPRHDVPLGTAPSRAASRPRGHGAGTAGRDRHRRAQPRRRARDRDAPSRSASCSSGHS